MQADDEFARHTDPYRRELLAHCYRMLGSVHDAEDLVQETYLRAWRGYPDFEGRSSLRTWLYRIATRACLTALEGRQRRPMPSGLAGPSDDPNAAVGDRLADVPWLQPFPDTMLDSPDDPAYIAAARQSTRLAMVAALQELPARQRAALILRDVLGWRAGEVADLLGTTWFAGRDAVQRFFTLRLRRPGNWRMVPVGANGQPALAAYLADEDGSYHAHGIQVLSVRGGKIAHVMAFLDPTLFPLFGQPMSLPGSRAPNRH